MKSPAGLNIYKKQTTFAQKENKLMQTSYRIHHKPN